jgi:hypothetical protein
MPRRKRSFGPSVGIDLGAILNAVGQGTGETDYVAPKGMSTEAGEEVILEPGKFVAGEKGGRLGKQAAAEANMQVQLGDLSADRAFKNWQKTYNIEKSDNAAIRQEEQRAAIQTAFRNAAIDQLTNAGTIPTEENIAQLVATYNEGMAEMIRASQGRKLSENRLGGVQAAVGTKLNQAELNALNLSGSAPEQTALNNIWARKAASEGNLGQSEFDLKIAPTQQQITQFGAEAALREAEANPALQLAPNDFRDDVMQNYNAKNRALRSQAATAGLIPISPGTTLLEHNKNNALRPVATSAFKPERPDANAALMEGMGVLPPSSNKPQFPSSWVYDETLGWYRVRNPGVTLE